MKKGGVKASGAITLIVYFLLLVLAVFNLLTVLKVEPIVNLLSSVEILGNILALIQFIFILFPLSIVSLITTLDAGIIDTITLVLSIVFAVFCLYMFIWGIKEITLAKKDDYKFAKCKKTCAFMHIIKFFVFLYFVAVIVCSFVLDGIKPLAEVYAEVLGVPYIVVIVAGVLALLQFICFVVAVANINKVAKAVKNGQVAQDPNAQYADPNYNPNGYVQNDPYQQQYSQGPQMQANMPPMNNGYVQPQYQQPQQQYQPQPQQYPDPGSSMIVPGQNGIPANITQKGIQDLERLERLRQSGAITDANYIVMRTKICNSNLS